MSSVTASRYEVLESAEERQRREQRAAWERFAVVRAELTVLQTEARSYKSVYGKVIAEVPATPKAKATWSPERIDRAAGEARQILATHRGKLRESVAQAVRAQARQTLAVDAPKPTAVKRATRSTVEKPDKAAEERRQANVERAAKLLSDLPASASTEARASCEKTVAELKSASPSRATLLLAHLEKQVRTEKKTADRVTVARTKLEELRARADALLADPQADHTAAQAALTKIENLIETAATEVPAGLSEELTNLAEQADRAYRRRMAANAVRMSFADLGYQVSEGFETLLAERGVAYTNLPRANGYGLKVLLDREQDVMRTLVVKTEHADKAADFGAQKVFCDDYPTLLARARRHGVELAELGARPPGEVAVSTVADEVLPVAADQQAGTYQRRERNL